MRYKEVKTYQAVKFQNQQETFFSVAMEKMKDVQMTEGSWGIRVTTAKDDVIISFNNIAWAKIDDAVGAVADPKSSKPAKLGL